MIFFILYNYKRMKTYDVTFKSGSTFYVAGPTQSGKTTLVTKIVKDRELLFDEKVSEVFWYSAFPPKDKLPNVHYIQGVPYDIGERIIPNCLVVIDDYMHELNESKELTSIITRATHHLPMCLIYITQNIFQHGSQSKTRRLNATYLILFKNPQDIGQVEYIGRQMFPQEKDFLTKAYRNTTFTSPFSYLMIDAHARTPDYLRVRTHITTDEQPVFLPSSYNLDSSII